MKVTLDISKSIEDNANDFYEKAKKAKKKLEGVKKAYKNTIKRIEKVKDGKADYVKETKVKKEKRKKDWYEKFRWFFSSEGFLVIGGRDATTNDIVVKKYKHEGDLIFHTEIVGSPFFIIQAETKDIGKNTMEETAEACASFSRAWKLNVATTDVYSFGPDQIKSEKGLPKGTFMIYGKRNYFSPTIHLAIGVYKDKPMCGPVSAVKKHCNDYLLISQGEKKKSDIAKKVRRYFLEKHDIELEFEDLLSVLPPGDCEVKEL
jgi:predicted ribosome quality control (RQC) complex YloA/Tae2 family protein